MQFTIGHLEKGIIAGRLDEINYVLLVWLKRDRLDCRPIRSQATRIRVANCFSD